MHAVDSDPGSTSVASVRRPLELLAPAGDRACVEAAVENGADAVYFGLAGPAVFNARARAANVPPEELAELIAYLHRRGVKGYVTLNTLVFPRELEQLQTLVATIAAAGADAVLVQDLGVARLAKAVCPELPVHASTQMSLSCAESIQVAKSLSIERVILPRELSLAEIRQIRLQTDLELETFAHGAMCIAYSGQCLASESLGGRSANRGQCAQACRMPYAWVCSDLRPGPGPGPGEPAGRNGPERSGGRLGNRLYLLSPHDLAAFDLVPEFIAAGVDAIKIEGRMKTAQYVAQTTHLYRRAIDAAMASRALEITDRDIEKLQLAFSRGFCHGWLEPSARRQPTVDASVSEEDRPGASSRQASPAPDLAAANGPTHDFGISRAPLVPGDFSSKRGILLGRVVTSGHDGVAVCLCASVQRGDGVVFEANRMQGDEQGGRVFEVFVDRRSIAESVASGTVDLTFRHGSVDFGALRSGQNVWKTADPRLDRELRRLAKADDPRRKVAVDLVVEAAAGSLLRIAATTQTGASCRVESAEPLATATKHPLTTDLLREQLGRLGGTVYELRRIDAKIHAAPMVPLSVLGKLRRALVEALDVASRQVQPRRLVTDPLPLPALRAAARGELPRASPSPASLEAAHAVAMAAASAAPASSAPQLHVLCRSIEQLHAVIECGADSAVVDLRDIGRYGEAVRLARHAGLHVCLATPRILKPGESGALRTIARSEPDGVLVRNLAALGFFRESGTPIVADFSLNAANELTVAWLIEQGAQRVTASFDLDHEQCSDLIAAVPPHRIELVVHQHMPMFFMEYCPFAAELAPGATKFDCGQPCQTHAVGLRDHAGVEHFLRAEFGCRTTLYNAASQSGAEFVPRWIAAGVRHFRVDLLDSIDSPRVLVGVYRDLLSGRIDAAEAWTRLRAAIAGSVTRGAMDVRAARRSTTVPLEPKADT